MDAVEPVAALVARRTGLFFPESRRQALAAAIANAIARTGARTAEDLVELLERVPAALDELVAEITIQESYFFRDPGQFEILRRDVLPEILRRCGPDHRLRLLSVGCAAGEEPYSLAILLDQEGLGGRSVVIGTDISRPSLARAAEASYGNWSLRGSVEDFRSRYFQREGSRFRLVQRIRDRVELTYLNLAEDFHPSHATGIVAFDVIFCRNALIYFDAGSIAGAAARLFSALAEGGWLVTGASDPPLADHAPFETVMTPAGLFYRRPDERAARPEPGVPAAPSPTAAGSPRRSRWRRWRRASSRRLRRSTTCTPSCSRRPAGTARRLIYSGAPSTSTGSSRWLRSRWGSRCGGSATPTARGAPWDMRAPCSPAGPRTSAYTWATERSPEGSS